MSDVEFIAPYYDVSIGNYALNKVITLETISSRINPCDLAKIKIDCLGVNSGDFKKDDPVMIALGYREKGLWKVFDGFVTDTSPQATIDIFAKDKMTLLKKPITKSFVDVTPQEIITFCLRAAGISQFVLSSKALNRKHYFVANGINAIEMIKLINRTWELDDWAFYFEPEGTFFWGPWEESERYKQDILTVFEYGKNIINLIPSDEETGTIETILLPFLRHSTLIEINDQRFWRRTVTARIERIRDRITEKKARTIIEWRIKMS